MSIIMHCEAENLFR